MRRGDDQDVSYPRQHQRTEGIVNHRFVVYRQQLFADRAREGIQPCAGTAGEDDAFHVCSGLISE